MSRPKGSKNKVKKQKNYDLSVRKLKKRGRPKGSKNNSKKQDNFILQPEQIKQAEQDEETKYKRKPKGSTNIKKQASFLSHYIPYEKSKTNKAGEVITYQTYKNGDIWLIDIYTNDDLTLHGFSENFTKLHDAIRYIDNNITRL